MNKTDMAERLAERTGMSKAVARDAVDGVFAAVGDALAGGKEVRIAGSELSAPEAGPHRSQSEDRRGGFDSGVDVADIQGGKDAEGCRQSGSRVVTLQRRPAATGGDSGRLDARGGIGRELSLPAHVSTTLRPLSVVHEVAAGIAADIS